MVQHSRHVCVCFCRQLTRFTIDASAAANAADNALQIRAGRNGMEIEGAISQVCWLND